MTRYFALIAIIFFPFLSIAQEPTNYIGLKSRGEIPEDFTKFTLQKIEEAKAEHSNSGDKTKDEFYEMSNFSIDQLLQSGNVCFNDTISAYVERVLEEIRSSNHNVPLDLRIYTIKSPVVNAFTTDQGIIFINTGLLAQLENESQLAFILCHEIIHYTENHIMEEFIQEKDFESTENRYQRVQTIDKELATSRFSRKLETEADIKGLELFLNTDYNPAEVDGVFDVLLYSYLPFDEIPFDSSIIEFEASQIPDKYFLKELNPIEVDENEDDSRNTHPNIAKRRKKTDDKLISAKQTGKNFIVSEKDFYTVRAAARYEVLRLQLINGDYSEALYSAFLLNREFPDNPLPQIAIGEILYGTALFANNRERKDVTGYYKKKQGNVQQAYYILNKIPSKDLTLLATRYNFKLAKKFPNNKTISERVEVLFRELVYQYDLSSLDFEFDKKVEESEYASSKEKESNASSTKKSKYDRIKSTKNKKKENTDSYDKDWAFSLFTDCGCEDEIEALFEKGKEASEKLKYQRAETDDDQLNKESLAKQRAYEKRKRKTGRSLGIDKIVIVEPFYAAVNYSKKNEYKYVVSEKNEVKQISELQELAKKVNLETEVLTNYTFNAGDVVKFNDFSLLGEWVAERNMMEAKSNIISSSDEVKNISARYGTKYFAWTGVVSAKYSATRKKTFIYFALFNIETGQLIMYEERPINLRASNGLLKTHFYDIFNQIKK